MNSYVKYAPNVFIARCDKTYLKCETVYVSTKYGKENACIVFNLIGEKDGVKHYVTEIFEDTLQMLSKAESNDHPQPEDNKPKPANSSPEELDDLTF